MAEDKPSRLKRVTLGLFRSPLKQCNFRPSSWKRAVNLASVRETLKKKGGRRVLALVCSGERWGDSIRIPKDFTLRLSSFSNIKVSTLFLGAKRRANVIPSNARTSTFDPPPPFFFQASVHSNYSKIGKKVLPQNALNRGLSGIYSRNFPGGQAPPF